MNIVKLGVFVAILGSFHTVSAKLEVYIVPLARHEGTYQILLANPKIDNGETYWNFFKETSENNIFLQEAYKNKPMWFRAFPIGLIFPTPDFFTKSEAQHLIEQVISNKTTLFSDTHNLKMNIETKDVILFCEWFDTNWTEIRYLVRVPYREIPHDAIHQLQWATLLDNGGIKQPKQSHVRYPQRAEMYTRHGNIWKNLKPTIDSLFAGEAYQTYERARQAHQPSHGTWFELANIQLIDQRFLGLAYIPITVGSKEYSSIWDYYNEKKQTPYENNDQAHVDFNAFFGPVLQKMLIEHTGCMERGKCTRHALIRTGDRILVYEDSAATIEGNYLGVGPRGTGENMVGRLLMQLRDKLNQIDEYEKLPLEQAQTALLKYEKVTQDYMLDTLLRQQQKNYGFARLNAYKMWGRIRAWLNR